MDRRLRDYVPKRTAQIVSFSFIVCLEEHGSPMPLSDLAEELASWVCGSPLPEIPADDVQSIYLTLYHHHISKMEDAGIIEYSQERDAVHLYEEYTPLTTLIDIERPSW